MTTLTKLAWVVAGAVAAGACTKEPAPAASPVPPAVVTPLPNLPPGEPANGVPGDQPPQIDDAQVEPPVEAPPPPPRRTPRSTPPRTAPPAAERDPVMSEAEKRRHEEEQAREREAQAAREREARERAEREAAEERERAARRVTLPTGATVRLAMATAVSSKTSKPGDAVEARIEGATSAETGEITIPRGALLRGRVEEAAVSGRVKGRARVRVVFDEIVVQGHVQKIEPIVLVKEAAADTKRDVAVAGGAAAAGAIIGGILDGGSGAGKGAIIGGAAGGATVLATRGKEVEIGPGDRQTVKVTETIRVE